MFWGLSQCVCNPPSDGGISRVNRIKAVSLENARVPKRTGGGHGLSEAESLHRKYAPDDKLLDFTPVISFLRFRTEGFEDVYLILENSNLIGVGASSQSSSGYQSPLRADVHH